jgi:hypothetical protein
MTPVDAATRDRVFRMHDYGVVNVFALWIPIFLWMAHLGSMAALVAYVGNHPHMWWVFWLDTGVCAAGTLLCMLVATLIGLRVPASEREGTPEGRTRFLAWQAVLAGTANLALILAEGSYVLFLTSAAHR